MPADALTCAWAEPAAQRCGFARLGVAHGRGSALAVLFEGREPVAAIVEGDLDLPAEPDPEHLELAGVRFDGHHVEVAFDGQPVALDFQPVGPPAEIAAGDPVARAGGMTAGEELCRVGDGVGQRTRQWGAPDWGRIALARTLTAWEPDGGGLTLTAVRPAKAKAHDQEAVWAALVSPEAAVEVADPRLSTTYDGDGRQRRAGLELWVGEDDPYPRRASGEVLCGSTLDLGQLRLDCAFFAWRLDGRPAIGRYDLLRRA